MGFKRKPPEGKKGAPLWMVTFSDLVTLVLVFFILLFSMSQIDIVKFKAIAESFKTRQILDFYPSLIPAENPSEESKAQDKQEKEKKEKESLEKLLGEVKNFLNENGLEDVVIANRTDRGVVLVLDEQVLFQSGEAEIVGGSSAFLNKVGTLLKDLPNLVKVEGHTDDRPITTFRYPSNWELSSARASSVIRYLVDNHNLDMNRFIAVGYGETRPLVKNSGPKNWKKNRRVEIVISDPSYAEDSLIDQ